jgi:low affinity Fe/Cu permease
MVTKLYAFKIEENLRKLLEDTLNPVVTLQQCTQTELEELRSYLD